MLTTPGCRTSLVCGCSMNLARFPLDQQTCHLNLASCELLPLLLLLLLYMLLLLQTAGPRQT